MTLALHWLPPHPAPRDAIRAARATISDDPAGALPEGALTALRHIAGHQHDFLGTMQVDRLATAAFAAAPGLWPEIKLALLGSSSMEHLLAPIRVAGARRGLRITPHLGAFGQFRQDLMAADGALRDFAPNVILLILRPADVMEALPLGATSMEVDAAVAAALAGLTQLWHAARDRHGATVIQQTFLDTGDPVFGNLDGAVAATSRSIQERLNRAVRDAAAQQGVLLLDAAHRASIDGRAEWFDPGLWHHAKQLIAPSAALVHGDLAGRLLAAMRGLSAKCLVLDLDNTLWGGVIGDDGLDGIVLGQGSAAGEAFVAFQTYAKLLSDRGVILAVCSKNTHDVAEAVFLEHPDMVLKRPDIAVFAANWNDKPSNLREIARTLNIGIDSLVFFDDNPAERAIVRQTLPEVWVPEVPEDPARYIACLADAGYFEAIAFTEEDRVRAEQYRANARRSEFSQSGTDIGAFLVSLDMRMIVAPFNAVDLPRITQLANKSNQFNLTTRRYTQDQMAAWAASNEAVTLSFRLIDKFGDNGLICVVIAMPDGDALRIDSWLMSCRVLGRQVEEEVVNQLGLIARERGFQALIGEYIPTAKNGMVRDLYRRMGFEPASGGADPATRWTRSLVDFQPVPTAIAIDARYHLQAAE